MNISGIIGLAVLVLAVGMPMAMTGDPGLFINPPSITICLGIGMGLELMTYGLRACIRIKESLHVLIMNVPRHKLEPEDAAVLRSFAMHIYVGGVLGTVIGLIQMLATVEDLSQVGIGIAYALITTFYAIIISEGILRPCAHRIEFLLAQDEDAGETEQ